jgi:hypothetical protein
VNYPELLVWGLAAGFTREQIDGLWSAASGPLGRVVNGLWTGNLADGPRAKFSLRGTPYADLWRNSDNVLVQYVRTGVSSIHDYQGYLHLIRANELGYEGLRRVENLCPDARNMTTGWTLDATGQVTDRTYIGGSATANRGVLVTRPSASTTMITMNSLTYEQDLHVISGKFWAASGSVTLRIQAIRSGDNLVVATRDITISSTPARRALAFTPADGTIHRIVFGLVAGTSFGMDEILVERKVDQVPHPSEFVTRGEAGAAWPFQGAGVDGVRYFDVLPYSFLEADGNVFDFLDRAPIPEATFLGVRRPPPATQRLLQTADLTAIASPTVSTATPWQKTNLGAVARVQNVANPVGRNHCYFLPETATTGAFELFQDWSGTLPASTSAPIPNAWYVRRGPGRKWVRISTRLADGTTTRSAWFDLERGVWGVVDAGIDVADLYAYSTGINDWWRIGHAEPVGAGATAPRFTLGVASDDGVTSYAGVAGNGLYVAAPMATEADHVTAYVGHTTTAVSVRGDGHVEVPITSNVPANDFTFHLDFTLMGARSDSRTKTGFHYIAYSYFDNNNRWGTCIRPGVAGGNAGDRDAAGWAQDYYPNTVGFDGVQVRTGLVTQRGQTVKQFFGQASVARNEAGGGSFMTLGGIKAYFTGGVGAGIPTTVPIANKASTIRLGSNVSAGKVDICIKNVVIWDRALTDAEMANAGSYR